MLIIKKDDTTITVEANILLTLRFEKRLVLSLLHNGSNSFLFVNAVENVLIQSKKFRKKPCPLSLGNVSIDFTVDDNMKKTGLEGSAYVFSVDYNIIDTNDILILR